MHSHPSSRVDEDEEEAEEAARHLEDVDLAYKLQLEGRAEPNVDIRLLRDSQAAFDDVDDASPSQLAHMAEAMSIAVGNEAQEVRALVEAELMKHRMRLLGKRKKQSQPHLVRTAANREEQVLAMLRSQLGYHTSGSRVDTGMEAQQLRVMVEAELKRHRQQMLERQTAHRRQMELDEEEAEEEELAAMQRLEMQNAEMRQFQATSWNLEQQRPLPTPGYWQFGPQTTPFMQGFPAQPAVQPPTFPQASLDGSQQIQRLQELLREERTQRFQLEAFLSEVRDREKALHSTEQQLQMQLQFQLHQQPLEGRSETAMSGPLSGSGENARQDQLRAELLEERSRRENAERQSTEASEQIRQIQQTWTESVAENRHLRQELESMQGTAETNQLAWQRDRQELEVALKDLANHRGTAEKNRLALQRERQELEAVQQELERARRTAEQNRLKRPDLEVSQQGDVAGRRKEVQQPPMGTQLADFQRHLLGITLRLTFCRWRGLAKCASTGLGALPVQETAEATPVRRHLSPPRWARWAADLSDPAGLCGRTVPVAQLPSLSELYSHQYTDADLALPNPPDAGVGTAMWVIPVRSNGRTAVFGDGLAGDLTAPLVQRSSDLPEESW